jgi:hypothetical protein
VPWQHLDGSWFALYFHRQRNIKFSFWRHILYWYNKINLLVMPKARPLRTKFQTSSCRRHEHSIVGMDPIATHCRKLIVQKAAAILNKKTAAELRKESIKRKSL